MGSSTWHGCREHERGRGLSIDEGGGNSHEPVVTAHWNERRGESRDARSKFRSSRAEKSLTE